MRWPAPETDLHVCRDCGRPFVVPEKIIAVLPRTEGYLMRLACTNCGHWWVGAFDEDAMTALDMELDRSQAQIAGALIELQGAELTT
jgi:hypothetical protein